MIIIKVKEAKAKKVPLFGWPLEDGHRKEVKEGLKRFGFEAFRHFRGIQTSYEKAKKNNHKNSD